MMVRSARIRRGSRRQSGAHPRIEWQWLLGLAMLSIASGCGPPTAGLRPLSPPMVVSDELWRMGLTDSLQPTLRWEAFPRPEDLKADKAGRLAAVRNPTYELRIWRAEDNLPAELVYARSGLPEPVHTLEIVLAPDTRYLWTIRARFQLNGEPRVTEWSAWVAGRNTEIHHSAYYWFKTPRQ